MRRSPKIVVLVAVSLFAMQPLAACFSDQKTLSEEECCQEMMGDCGQVTMPTSHSCCTYVDGGATARLETREPLVTPSLFFHLPQAPEPAPLVPQILAGVQITAESPPQPPSPSIQILRI